jgi:hypothetical protein
MSPARFWSGTLTSPPGASTSTGLATGIRFSKRSRWRWPPDRRPISVDIDRDTRHRERPCQHSRRAATSCIIRAGRSSVSIRRPSHVTLIASAPLSRSSAIQDSAAMGESTTFTPRFHLLDHTIAYSTAAPPEEIFQASAPFCIILSAMTIAQRPARDTPRNLPPMIWTMAFRFDRHSTLRRSQTRFEAAPSSCPRLHADEPKRTDPASRSRNAANPARPPPVVTD